MNEGIVPVLEKTHNQHFLKAAVAPCLLLTFEALRDLWANPADAWQTRAAAREIYRFPAIEERTGIWYREGGRAHSRPDWETLLDFMNWHFRGREPVRRYARDPFSTA
jgi:hypothetical protein